MQEQLAPGVHYAGHIDWRVRDFHGYRTGRGSSYNAYLVVDERSAVIDTVKAPFFDSLLERVRRHVAPEQIAYLVCNHAEPDHSSALPALVAACPNAVVVCNRKCQDALRHHFDTATWRFQIVSDGETLSLGARSLQFFDTPMVHWPESMVTYLPAEELLFSMDAFGQHYASAWLFDDEAPIDVVMAEARTYYANIVMPFGRQVRETLARLGGLKIRLAAPSHGIVWRSHLGRILAAYDRWSTCRPLAKVVILYATMWDSTRLMAEAIAAGVQTRPVDLRLIDLNAMHDTDVMAEVLDCASLAVGSATLNMGIMPRLASTLTYMRGLRPQCKRGVAFGSHGWANKAVEEIGRYFEATGIAAVAPPLTSRFRADAAALDACRAMGVRLADLALESAAAAEK